MYFLINLTVTYTANALSINNQSIINEPKATAPVLAILIRGNAIPRSSALTNTIPTIIASMYSE